LFSGYLSDFELVLPQQIKTLLKKKLKSSVPIKSTTKPREIPPLVKYELGYEAYKILGRSDEAMAWMALRASWVARDEYCNLPRNPQLADVLIEAGKLVPLHDKNMNPARRELDQAKALENIVENTAISPDMRWAYRSVIALLYRRHGENEKSLSYLNEVQRSNKAPSDVRIAITEMKDSLVSETKWQTLSAGHFHSAITKGKISPQNLTVAKYLLGVLYFRLGMEQDALVWFKSAEKDQPLPVPIDQWIQQFKGRMK
jgi:tetratricopeptide (TPR) repeat protein